MPDARDLALVVASGAPLILMETHDEPRAIDLLTRVARDQQRELFQWTCTDGLRRVGFGLQVEQPAEYAEAETLLRHLKERAGPGLYALCDLHHWLHGEQPRLVRLLKDIALRQNAAAVTLALISHRLPLPPELARLAARFELVLPDEAQLLGIVRDEARRWARLKPDAKVRSDDATLKRLVANLRGLSHGEARRLARGAIVDDGAITESDIDAVNRAKFRLLDADSVLSFEYRTERFAEVGGMANLKAWLELRRGAFVDAAAPGGDIPKGILLLGVQGGGKSLAAKAVAGLWGIPLLRLDVGALYNKYHGETERNLREALQLAEAMAPAVLWLDEIEKGLSTADQDGGTSQRVLATLLTWMAERTSRVFLVATANDITRLPPELLRKGRFDELFFVDLPDAATRADILGIHLQRRGLAPERFDLPALAALAEQCSGAELEQAIVSAHYGARARNAELDQAALAAELLRTTPLATLMAERIQGLRDWARERGVQPA
ncbi:MAG: AAA family ATPase [Pseudomonadales bacterium]|nr:AAA family ATPase [Pseudomonadales bacterium]